MAHINGSGVQEHSAGDHFPYVVYLREFWISGEAVDRRIMVSLGGPGHDLAGVPSWREGHELAALFKKHNVRTIAEALQVQVWEFQAEQDAEKFAVSRSEGMKRQRNDYAEMYGDPNHVPLTGPEVMEWKRSEARRFERAWDESERQREVDQAYRDREAKLAAAREEFFADAEMNGIGLIVQVEHAVQVAGLDQFGTAYAAEIAAAEQDSLDAARRALGIIE